MNVALDANVLIKDPWLRSQTTRALLDYLAKTPWCMVVSEVVEAEVRAHWRREFEESAERVAASLRKAKRAGVFGLPDFDARAAAERTLEAWEDRWREVLDATSARRVPVGAKEAAEAARRAAFRQAPCSATGEGMRDALIWLALVTDAAATTPEMGSNPGLAFVSDNTKDFAAPDKASLKDELLRDVSDHGAHLTYYPSLDDFLRERAEPVGHITREWVLSSLDLRRLEELVCEQVRSGRPYNAFRINDVARRRLYDIAGEPEPRTVALGLEDFYVWQFDDGHAELHMTFVADVEASIECINLPDPQISELTGLTYWDYEESEDNPLTLLLDCSAKFAIRVSAHVEGGGLSKPFLEDVHQA